MAGYEPDNIFAKILRGEMPAHVVYEDDSTLAFMDVMPRADGHVLVIPKAPSRNLLDASDAVLSKILPEIRRLAVAAEAAFKAEGVTIQQFNESAGGQVIFHTHVHVLPRWTDVPLKPHTGQMEPPEALAAMAAKIRDAMAV